MNKRKQLLKKEFSNLVEKLNHMRMSSMYSEDDYQKLITSKQYNRSTAKADRIIKRLYI